MADVQTKDYVKRKLDRAAIDEHRKRLGVKFNTTGQMRGPNQWVFWDRVNGWTKGMGDLNPLYTDEEYAKQSCYGTVVAPPSFVISVWHGMVIQGLPGVHLMMGSNDYEFLTPMLEGDKITAECVFARLNEKSSKFADLFLIEEYDNTFTNQHGRVAVKQVSKVIRHDREGTQKGLENVTKAAKVQFPHPWTVEEVRAFEEEQLDKKIQGNKPLFWEDVTVGESIPDLLRGPYSITDSIAQVASHNVMQSGMAGLYFHTRQHPGYAFFHSMSSAHEHIEIIHWDKEVADYYHFPHPYDFGHSRQAWVMNAVTDWMGDHSWLKKNSAKYHRMVYLSDVVRIKSKITKKYIDENGEHCVDIVHNGWNQREEDVIPAQSTVILPSREKDMWPVKMRLAAIGRSNGK